MRSSSTSGDQDFDIDPEELTEEQRFEEMLAPFGPADYGDHLADMEDNEAEELAFEGGSTRRT